MKTLFLKHNYDITIPQKVNRYVTFIHSWPPEMVSFLWLDTTFSQDEPEGGATSI